MVPQAEQEIIEEIDTEAYELDSTRPTDPGRSHADGRTGEVSSFVSRSRIGLLKILEASPSFFRARVSALRMFRNFVLGILLIIVGFWLIARMDRAAPQVRGPSRLYGIVIALPFALVTVGIGCFGTLRRLGFEIHANGAERVVELKSFFSRETIWESEDIGGVVFLVTTSLHSNEGDPTNRQSCELYLVDREGMMIAEIEQAAFNEPEVLQDLARIAFHLARLLNIPICVELRGRPMHPSVEQAVELVENLGARRTGHLVPTLRKPLIRIESVSLYLGMGFMALGCTWFFLKHVLGFPL